MIQRQPDILIQVERRHPAPVEFHPDQFAVQQQRRASSSQAEHHVGLFVQHAPDNPGRDVAARLGLLLIDDLHVQRPKRLLNFAVTSAFNLSINAVVKSIMSRESSTINGVRSMPNARCDALSVACDSR